MTCSILIVEDDADVRDSLGEVLEDHEYQTIGVANGEEALAWLRANQDRPCVILLDMMMPVMDGWQFRAAQQKDPELSTIPVVVLTANANVPEVGRQLGVTALKKPVQIDRLLQTIEQFC